MPRIGTSNIRRKRAEEKLSKLGNSRFAFISAPAGYGKTTAVIDYITRENRKHAWFSIDADDNDPSRFWKYVTSAIARCTGQEEIAGISTDGELVLSNITIDLLIKAIEAESEAFVLVLDDFHLIHNIDIHNNVEHFVKYMPENVSLIITSRTEPARGLALLCIKGIGFLLDRKDLAFSEENTKEYFSQKEIHISNREYKDIYKYSEGWPAGIVAAAMSIREKGNRKEYPTMSSAMDQNIAFYLEVEVFDCWPEETKEFLIMTSFLDKLSGPICSAVTGNARSADILETLAQNNGFVISLDTNKQWYRYHNLFQEFLLAQLEQFVKAERRSLYLLAADWFFEQEMLEDAIKWLLEAKEYQRFVPIFLKYMRIAVLREARGSNILLVRKWYASVPEEYFYDSPIVFTGYSWIAFMDNDIHVLKKCVQNAHKSYNRIQAGLNPDEREYFEVVILFSELNIAIYEMDLARIFICFEKMRRYKPNTNIIVGDLNWFEPCLLNTRYGFMGRLQKADAYKSVEAEMYPFMRDNSGYVATIIAETFYMRNKLDQTMELMITHMPSIVKRCGAIVPAFILQAKIKMAQRDVAGAFSIIEEARKLLGEKADSVWGYHLDVFEAKLYTQTGEYERAYEKIESNKLGVYDTPTCVREPEHLVFARLLIHSNRLDDALILLKKLEEFARGQDRLASLMEILCLTAVCYSMKVDYSSAVESLKHALDLGSKEGYIRTFVDEREPMSTLLDRYVAQNRNGGAGKHLAYARNLLKQTNEFIGTINWQTPSEIRPVGTQEIFNKIEQELLKYMTENATNQQMADELFLSINTIKKYNSRIFDKLGASNRFEAIQKAKKLGILK
jgi:LuxR family maltose regulon positive regulatory protein